MTIISRVSAVLEELCVVYIARQTCDCFAIGTATVLLFALKLGWALSGCGWLPYPVESA